MTKQTIRINDFVYRELIKKQAKMMLKKKKYVGMSEVVEDLL